MKLIIEDENPEQVIKLSLKKYHDSVYVTAFDGNKEKRLLRFDAFGEVFYCENAAIGDFKFDERGRMKIKNLQ